MAKSKGPFQCHARFEANTSEMVIDHANVIIAIKESREGFQLEYLHLTLANSKGHIQGHARFTNLLIKFTWIILSILLQMVQCKIVQNNF